MGNEALDGWTFCHIAVAAALGAGARALGLGRCAWPLCLALILLWEGFEALGRERGWTFVRPWFEYESPANVALDIAVGVAGVSLGLRLHRALRG